MAAPEVVEPIMQKDGGDCSIAVLAMFLNKPYQEVSKAALEIFPKLHPHKDGLDLRQIRALAHHFGTTLQSLHPSKVNLDEETGILSIIRKNKEGHVALIFQGVIIEPSDGLIYSVDAYRAYHDGCKFTRFLR